jgi:hypothetical protein
VARVDQILSQVLSQVLAADYSGFGFSGLSSWSIGGHSPLLQRSQNFLLLTAAVELVPLASGPPSLLQAASVPRTATSIPAAINRDVQGIAMAPARQAQMCADPG